MHSCGAAAGGSRECVREVRVLTIVWGNICVGRLDGGEMAWVDGVVVSSGVWWGFSGVSGIGGVGTGGGVVVMMMW